MAMYDNQMDIAFAGMKADSGDDRVESFAVGAETLGFGLVCGDDTAGVIAGKGTKVRGITLHSHAVPGNTYVKTECASVMTRGLVWALVTASGAVTEDGAVKYGSDGTVADAGANTLTNATFRSGIVLAGVGSGSGTAATSGRITASASLGGADFTANNLAFKVDGTQVTLTTDLSTQAGVATAIENALTGYSVTANASGVLTIVNDAKGAQSTAPAITDWVSGGSTEANVFATGTKVDGLAGVNGYNMALVELHSPFAA